MKINIVIEDSKPKGSAFIAEYGLCLYFVYQGKRILFDTGASDAFIYNATLLGIDLLKVDMCILSHAHEGHTGGLAYFFGINKDAPVYMKSAARGDFYIRRLTKMEYAGMDRSLLEKYPDRFRFIDDDAEILDGLFLSGVRKHRKPPLFASTDVTRSAATRWCGMTCRRSSSSPCAAATASTVINGCSHNGLINVLMTAEEKYGPVAAVVGGFHLSGDRRPGMPAFQELPAKRGNYPLHQPEENQKVYNGHCTGEKTLEKLEMMARVKRIQSGDVIKI